MEKIPNRWALFEYSTKNMGDDIQSIAAKRFLPQVDYYINRDRIGSYSVPCDEPVGIIANGWYMNAPRRWPPSDPLLQPLLVSIHLHTKSQRTTDVLSEPASLDYFRRFGPVGARDISTMEFLRNHDVESWLSGCLTLTLNPDPRVNKEEYVLAVDLPADAVAALRSRTDRPVIEVSPFHYVTLTRPERTQLAEFLLMLYQSAHCVVSSRLHAALPCLALGTPVLVLMNEKLQDGRLDGLSELVTKATNGDLLSDSNLNYDVDNPPANPDSYKDMRSRLESRVKEYTGYDGADLGATYLSTDPSKLITDPVFLSVIGKFLSASAPSVKQARAMAIQEQQQSRLTKQLARGLARLARGLRRRILGTSKVNHMPSPVKEENE